MNKLLRGIKHVSCRINGFFLTLVAMSICSRPCVAPRIMPTSHSLPASGPQRRSRARLCAPGRGLGMGHSSQDSAWRIIGHLVEKAWKQRLKPTDFRTITRHLRSPKSPTSFPSKARARIVGFNIAPPNAGNKKSQTAKSNPHQIY